MSGRGAAGEAPHTAHGADAHNILLLTDSYKVTHHLQYPPGTETIYSYFECRGGEYEEVCFFGLQYYLKQYLVGSVVTKQKIDEAETFFRSHFSNPASGFNEKLFNRSAWEHIVKRHGGRLPILIKAVPEGTVLPQKNVLFTMENTDPHCFWLTNYLESLLVQVWYPTTVCTQSREQKKIIMKYLMDTGCESALDRGMHLFKLHDFGFRGVSSVESSAIGGVAHLVNFLGGDTLSALVLAKEFYSEACAGYSIPASEHSTMTTWGRERELDAMRNMLEQYPTGMMACVSDSFDIFRACTDYWGDALRELVEKREGLVVIRPDSGKLPDTVITVLEKLESKFGHDKTQTGHKLLPSCIRVLQGDGIDIKSMEAILKALMDAGWAADNIAFGSGGALLQKLHRDTLQCAFKCSHATISGKGVDVVKDPITDPGKKSKKGRLTLEVRKSEFVTVVEGKGDPAADILVEVFRDGRLLVDDPFEAVRLRAVGEILAPRAAGEQWAAGESAGGASMEEVDEAAYASENLLASEALGGGGGDEELRLYCAHLEAVAAEAERRAGELERQLADAAAQIEAARTEARDARARADDLEFCTLPKAEFEARSALKDAELQRLRQEVAMLQQSARETRHVMQAEKDDQFMALQEELAREKAMAQQQEAKLIESLDLHRQSAQEQAFEAEALRAQVAELAAEAARAGQLEAQMALMQQELEAARAEAMSTATPAATPASRGVSLDEDMHMPQSLNASRRLSPNGSLGDGASPDPRRKLNPQEVQILQHRLAAAEAKRKEAEQQLAMARRSTSSDDASLAAAAAAAVAAAAAGGAAEAASPEVRRLRAELASERERADVERRRLETELEESRALYREARTALGNQRERALLSDVPVVVCAGVEGDHRLISGTTSPRTVNIGSASTVQRELIEESDAATSEAELADEAMVALATAECSVASQSRGLSSTFSADAFVVAPRGEPSRAVAASGLSPPRPVAEPVAIQPGGLVVGRPSPAVPLITTANTTAVNGAVLVGGTLPPGHVVSPAGPRTVLQSISPSGGMPTMRMTVAPAPMGQMAMDMVQAAQAAVPSPAGTALLAMPSHPITTVPSPAGSFVARPVGPMTTAGYPPQVFGAPPQGRPYPGR